MSFFKAVKDPGIATSEGGKAVQRALDSDNVFTSILTVLPFQRVNVGILVGSIISDIISAGAGLSASVVLGAAISAVFSTASMSITLQRQMREEMGTDFWRDVDAWSITFAEGEAASSENISDKSEPEIANYRLGTKEGGYETGLALIRLGTS